MQAVRRAVGRSSRRGRCQGCGWKTLAAQRPVYQRLCRSPNGAVARRAEIEQRIAIPAIGLLLPEGIRVKRNRPARLPGWRGVDRVWNPRQSAHRARACTALPYQRGLHSCGTRRRCCPGGTADRDPRRRAENEDVIRAPRHRKVTRLWLASTGSTIGVPCRRCACQNASVLPPAEMTLASAFSVGLSGASICTRGNGEVSSSATENATAYRLLRVAPARCSVSPAGQTAACVPRPQDHFRISVRMRRFCPSSRRASVTPFSVAET